MARDDLIQIEGTVREVMSGGLFRIESDKGQKFKETKAAPAFPEGDGRALANIWSIEPGGDGKDLLCGVEPAALFRSGDGGDSWEMVDGISNHPHARQWHPGNGGLCMHTIYREGNRVHLGISTGGHYLSEDGGQTFAASNNGVGAGFTSTSQLAAVTGTGWPSRSLARARELSKV